MMRSDVFLTAWTELLLLPHQILVWHKSRIVLTRCDYRRNYEPCLYGWVRESVP